MSVYILLRIFLAHKKVIVSCAIVMKPLGLKHFYMHSLNILNIKGTGGTFVKKRDKTSSLKGLHSS